MDAHLFRRVCEQLLPILRFSRIDSIAALSPHIVQCKLYGTSGKQTLLIYISRDKPCLMLLPQALSPQAFGQGTPTAAIMRLRKYALKRRILDVTCSWLSRTLHLHIGGDTPCVLTIDMRRGLSLSEVLPKAFPDTLPYGHLEEDIVWPHADDLRLLSSATIYAPEALVPSHSQEDLWRTYPVLTPALRRTLACLEPMEQEALLVDLQDGGGDVFAVYDEHGIQAVHAWPLPEALCKGRTQKTFENAFEAMGEYGKRTVLDVLGAQRHNEERQTIASGKVRLQRLVQHLDKDCERLKKMQAQQEDARILQIWLHSLPAHTKISHISLPDNEGDTLSGNVSQERHIVLNPALTILENMQAMFHTASRGKRGLGHVARRREEALMALTAYTEGVSSVHTKDTILKKQGQGSSRKAYTGLGRTKAFPKNIQILHSKDGFTLWRGRDAKGNIALLRQASPHDLWLHVENGPGAHVVIRRDHPQHEIPESTLREAVSLCVAKSWCSALEGTNISVMTAFVRHVRPKRGASVGTVDVQCRQNTLHFKGQSNEENEEG